MNSELSFSALRSANTARVPVFKNKHGAPAHARPDGSDWSPAMWLVALLGEVGEVAEVREAYEAGRLSFDDYRRRVADELADVQTYLDLFARRSLDSVYGRHAPQDPAQRVLALMCMLGTFCNAMKKAVRGDMPVNNLKLMVDLLHGVAAEADALAVVMAHTPEDVLHQHRVDIAHTAGVDLGAATARKFNEVSDRVGSSVRL